MMYQANNQTAEAARLEDYIQAVSHRKLLVLALTALGLLGAFLVATARTQVYTATATVIVNPTPVGAENGRMRAVNLDRERQVLESTVTAEQAIARLEDLATTRSNETLSTEQVRALLGLPITPEDLLEDIEVSFQPLSDSLEVAYTSPGAERSQFVATEFATAYTETREGEAAAHSDHLFVIDPVDIISTSDRLERKGGREIMTRCPTSEDAEQVSEWLVDRLSRLHPEMTVTSRIDEGGGQFLVILQR